MVLLYMPITHEISDNARHISIDGSSLWLASQETTRGKQAQIIHLLDEEGDKSAWLSKRYDIGLDKNLVTQISSSFTSADQLVSQLSSLVIDNQLQLEQAKSILSAFTEASALEIISEGYDTANKAYYKGSYFMPGQNGYDLHLIMGAVLLDESDPNRLAKTLDLAYLPEFDMGKITIAIARSLNSIPSNMLHRDLKRNNVLLAERGEDYLGVIIDFGIACIDGINPITMLKESLGLPVNTLHGTPGHISPESMSFGKEDQASDTFSIGAMMMAMFTECAIDLKHDKQNNQWIIRAKKNNGFGTNPILTDLDQAISFSIYPYLEKIILSSLETNKELRIFDRRIPLLLAGLLINAHHGIGTESIEESASNEVMSRLHEIVDYTTRTDFEYIDGYDEKIKSSIRDLPNTYQETMLDVMRAETIDELVAKLRNGGRG
jgi:serine/threonine protein kinase